MSISGAIYILLRHGCNCLIYPGAFWFRPRYMYKPSDLAADMDSEEVFLTASDGVRLQAYVMYQPKDIEDSATRDRRRRQSQNHDESTSIIREEAEGGEERSMEDLEIDPTVSTKQHARRKRSRTSRASSRRSSNATFPHTPVQLGDSSHHSVPPVASAAVQSSDAPIKRASTSSSQKTSTPTTPSSPPLTSETGRSTESSLSEPEPEVHPVTPTILMFHGNMDNIGGMLERAWPYHRGASSYRDSDQDRENWYSYPKCEGWGFDYEFNGSDREPIASTRVSRIERASGRMKKLQDTLGVVKCNVVMLSPRGYGHSGGTPSMKGIQRDADAALEYIKSHPRLGKTPIILYGLSLGGAIAIDLAARHGEDISGLIIENTFKSLRDVVQDKMPLVRPLAFFLKAWNSMSRFPPPARNHTGCFAKFFGFGKKGVPSSVPILMLVGEQDTVVPRSHMRALWDAATYEGDTRSGESETTRDSCTEVPRVMCTNSSVERSLVDTVNPEHISGCNAPLSDFESQKRRKCDDNVRSRLATYASFSEVGHGDTSRHPGYWGIVGGFLERCVERFTSLDSGAESDNVASSQRGRMLREERTDSQSGVGRTLGVNSAGREPPTKKQSWDELAQRRTASWENVRLQRQSLEGGAKAGGNVRARSRSTPPGPPSPSIMENLATASTWTAAS